MLELPASLVRPTSHAIQIIDGGERRFVYIHGIKNKAPETEIRCQWDKALHGADHPRSLFAYWVNRQRYPAPKLETCADDDITDDVLTDDRRGFFSDSLASNAEIAALALTDEELEWFGELADEMEVAAARNNPKRLYVVGWIVKRLVKAFWPDAHDYLFNTARHAEIDAIFANALTSAPGPVVVIAHSMGTVIAYEGLRKLSASQIDVPLFITMGSPLGISKIRGVLRKWSGGEAKLPRLECVGRWVNVSNKEDPVCAERELSGYFLGSAGGSIEDNTVSTGSVEPHSASGYLRTLVVKKTVGEL
jgi:hypothetical protein